jgi:DNA-binding response OmpR family regulator
MPRVLLVEDDEALAEALALGLGGLGHRIRLARTGSQALDAVFGPGPVIDVVLLDVMLPDLDGFEVCRRIRAKSMVPVLMLTARGDPVDVVVGLEGGADDYVVKPTEPRVLDARMKAVLRRVSAGSLVPEPALRFGALSIDVAALVVTRGDVELRLTATELRLLIEFARHPGQVLSRQALLKRVWEYGYVGDSRIVDATVARLRAKVEDDPVSPALLKTVRGFGYRLVPP